MYFGSGHIGWSGCLQPARVLVLATWTSSLCMRSPWHKYERVLVLVCVCVSECVHFGCFGSE